MAFNWNDVGQILGGAGDAIGQFRQARTLADLGKSLETGDYKGAARAALAGGDLGTGVSLLKLGQAAEEKRLQRESDANAFGMLGGGQPANLAANDEVTRYIADAATKRGIDPNVALRVYGSEGRGGYSGDQGSSFGPFQLHYGGVAPGGNRVAGLGDEFTKATGLDARNPETWKQQVDFALDQAAKGGWGPFHGAAKVGVGERAGIGGNPVQVADASGTIPASAAPSAPQTDPLEKRINDITRAISRPNISPNARQILSVQLQEAERRRSEARQDANRQEDRAFQRANLRETRAARQSELDLKRQERSDQVEKQTGEQANAATFATRMAEADKIISDPSVFGAGLGVSGGVRETVKNIPAVGNALAGAGAQGPKFQQYDQARRDFVNAVLRKESGAAINESEFKNAERQYFPIPGDSPEVIAQKAKNRATAIDTIAAGGNNTFRKSFSEKRAAPQGGPAVGSVEDGYRFKGGNPADPNSWERAQ